MSRVLPIGWVDSKERRKERGENMMSFLPEALANIIGNIACILFVPALMGIVYIPFAFIATRVRKPELYGIVVKK